MEIKAYAKINITLDVLYKRPDGYHELLGVMREISLHDTLVVLHSDEISVTSDLPLPHNNTMRRAAELFMERTGRGADIHIQKRIPSEAGLGGGSADGAAVLKAMNALYGEPLGMDTLMELGLSVGADVPFCLMGGCAVAEGVGERLTPIPNIPLNILLLKGDKGVSTAALFKGLRLPVEHPDTAGAIAAIKAADREGLYACCGNALEAPAAAILPEIAYTKARLLSAGARTAFMTGSGSCVVGLFDSRDEAQRAKELFDDMAFACICE